MSTFVLISSIFRFQGACLASSQFWGTPIGHGRVLNSSRRDSREYILLTTDLFISFISESWIREQAVHGILSPPSSVVTMTSESSAYSPFAFLGQIPACMSSIGVLFL